MSAERWRSSRVCVGLHSPPVRRSFDKEIGATRVVVVMFYLHADCARPRGLAVACAGAAETDLGVFLRTSSNKRRKSRTCARVMMKGGSKRKVKSWVQLMSRP